MFVSVCVCVEDALCHTAGNKAGCSSGILPEIVKVICWSVL